MKKTSLVIILALWFAAAHGQAPAINRGAAVPQEVIDTYEARDFNGMPYRFLLPVDYDSAKRYPLILNLHGRAGVGNDNKSHLRNWTAIFTGEEWRKKYPCVVVAPQSMDTWSVTGEETPELTEARTRKYSEAWRLRIEQRDYSAGTVSEGSLTKAFQLVDKIATDYNIDKDRIYVLGHSMGGFGSWNAIWDSPKKFAAAVPSAGGLLPWKDCANFTDVPIWAFHGGNDTTVPTDFTREIFTRIKELGGNMKYTELEGVAHNASQYAFDYDGDDEAKGHITKYSSNKCDKTPNVWNWLFEQKLKGENRP